MPINMKVVVAHGFLQHIGDVRYVLAYEKAVATDTQTDVVATCVKGYIGVT